MKNWSLNSKIYFLLSIFIIASAMITYTGLEKMNGIKTGLNQIVDGPMVRRINANRLNTAFGDQQIAIRNLVLAEDQAEREERKKAYDEGRKLFLKLNEKSLKESSEAGKNDLKKILELHATWIGKNVPIIELGMQGKVAEAAHIMRANRGIRAQIDKLIDSEIMRNKEDTDVYVAKADTDFRAARTMMIVTSLAAIVSGLILAFFILKAIGKSIEQVISDLTENSNQVTSAAQQIALSSENLSKAATEQASALEQTAASIEQMNSMVQKNSDSARRTSDLANTSNETAVKGKSVVTDMIRAIDDISASNTNIMHQIDDSNRQIADIVKVISEIGEKTKIINDIVFQTKLLSFNASVEAARAGEHGKGFAVVAEEVGNLAQMSGNAAQEISSMLDGSIQKVEGIVGQTKEKVGFLVQEGKQKVEVGSRIARNCGHVLDEIVHNFASVTQMANEISTACLEQSQGVQEITKAMNQLDQVTQSNAASSEQTASSAEELSSQSEALRGVVTVLAKTIKGSNDGSAPGVTHHKVSERKSQQDVIPMKKKHTPVPVKRTQARPMKKAVGSFDGNIPTENDPRFEDV